MIVEFIDGERDEFGVEPICDALQVAPSSYYAAKRREVDPSPRAARDAVMMQVLMVLWVANRKVTPEVHPARADLDEEQHVEPSEGGGVDAQEVGRDDRLRLGADELGPGRSRTRLDRADPSLAEDLPYRRGSDVVAESAELTVDPSVAHVGFSDASRTISCLSSTSTGGRP